jgi:hypothetical protein
MLDKVKLFLTNNNALAGGSRFFKSLGVPGFNAGGVVGGNTNINASGAFKIDMDLLAYKIAHKQ